MTIFSRTNRIYAAGGESTLANLADSGRIRFARWVGKQVAFHSDDPLALIAAIMTAASTPFDLAPLPLSRRTIEWRRRLAPLVTVLAEEREGRLTESPGDAVGSVARGGLMLFTSGSTGEPKLVRHSFESLNTYARTSVASHRWLVTYLTGTYAWVQVLMLGLVVPDQTLVFPASLQADDLLDALVRHGVTAVPSTPTFWRYLLATVPQKELTRLPIRQITLGGERADQAILDQLRSVFPAAAITHIFATTETGPALAVSDGLAGFPMAFLSRPVMGGEVELKIQNKTLWVRSPFRHLGAPEWVDTGDIAEQREGRVYIVGRRGHETISVGGQKVWKQAVEDVVRQVKGVMWARVYGVPAKLVGHLVGADVVVDPAIWADATSAEAAIVNACRTTLPEEAVPRFVRFYERIPINDILKTSIR
jgi:acyl-CoA synthetase (AMP-forming)/AMP-acid ligase II